MATEVYTVETVLLLDDTEVELRPLPIAKLRKFTRMWSDHLNMVRRTFVELDKEPAEGEDGQTEADREAVSNKMTDAQFDVFIKMCALGLESQLKGEKTDKQFLSHLEDILDEHTIYRILERTGGLNMSDNVPNQMPPVNPGAGTI